MKTVVIPMDYDPFKVIVNNVEYSYKAGSTVEVPDEVAAVIENFIDGKPDKANYPDGYVLTRIPDGNTEWKQTMQKSRVDFDGSAFKIGGKTLNYKELYDYHLTKPDFTFVVYGDRAYLLSYVQDDDGMKEMRFQSVIAVTDASGFTKAKTSGIYVTSSDGVNIASVRVVDVNSENEAYKATEINDGNKDSGVLYPSVKAVTNYSAGVYPNAGSHNSIFRGKYLGTAVTDEQWANIANGTFKDLFIGDYWTINGVNWRIASFDYWLNCGDTAMTKHHAVIVPDTILYNHKMNESNVTTGAYAGSLMRASGLSDALVKAESAFGSSHIANVRRYFANATSNGKPSAGAWFDSKCDLMTEAMVYGTNVFSSVSDGSSVPTNYNVDYKQLNLFALAPWYICNRNWYWLQNVVSATYFAGVNNYGFASYGLASVAHGVRPAFAIG